MVADKKSRAHDFLRTIELRAQAVHEGMPLGPNDPFNPDDYAELKGIQKDSTVPETAIKLGVDQETWDAMDAEGRAAFK